jgi:glyoxylate reductase
MTVLRDGGANVRLGESEQEKLLERGALLDGVDGADVLVSQPTELVDREVLERNERLLGVTNVAVGYDNVDVRVATELGIPVGNTPGVLTDTTADLTWALLLGVARRIPEADTYVREGRFRIWGTSLFLGVDVSPGGSGRRKVLGIVGFGRIGQAVARRAVGFDMEVLAHSPRRESVEAFGPPVRYAEMDEIVERSDFLTLHCRLTPETVHLIGEPELRRMKPGAYLLNVARGPVVDEEALVRALREGWIAGAGLDVFEAEPELADGLAELDNVVLAPHIGSATRDTRDRMAVLAAENALSYLKRERAERTVNPEVFETDAYRRRIER